MDVDHIIPSNDIKEHQTHEGCPCKPAISADHELVVHMAFDGREFYDPAAERLWRDIERKGVLQ